MNRQHKTGTLFNNQRNEQLAALESLPMPPKDQPRVTERDLEQSPSSKNVSTSKKHLNTPLAKSGVERPQPVATGRRGSAWMHDFVSIIGFIMVVIAGAVLINNYVFRSFDVVGPSMEPTLEGEGSSDRLIVNRVVVTMAGIQGKQYTPNRGDIIVFKNPNHDPLEGTGDEYIVKRVIGLPGERVTVNDCTLKVHNKEHPDGFNPYTSFTNLAANDKQVNTCVDGDGTDVTVPKGEIFVTGDHRVGSYSMDSRNGEGRASLGTIPLEDVIGPVALRIWPLTKITIF